jgi:hypothetical protein
VKGLSHVEPKSEGVLGLEGLLCDVLWRQDLLVSSSECQEWVMCRFRVKSSLVLPPRTICSVTLSFGRCSAIGTATADGLARL